MSGTCRGPPTGVLLCRSAHQALKVATWVGSCSVVQCIRCLIGQPLYCSAANVGMWRKKGYGDGSTHYVWLSSVVLLPWLLAFLHRGNFSPQSPPSYPLNTSLCSHQQPPPWDCSTISKHQLPAAASPSGVCMAAARTVSFSFHLMPQICCFTLSL